MAGNDQLGGEIVRREERLTGGFIEAWRRADSDRWFLMWRPDIDSPSDYPGHTFTPDEAGVANDPNALLAWARKKFGEATYAGFALRWVRRVLWREAEHQPNGVSEQAKPLNPEYVGDMRRRLALAAVSIACVLGGSTAATVHAAPVAIAKTCSAGYVHANLP